MSEDFTDFDPRAWAAGETFTVAKTVPEAPHEYLVAQRAADPDGFRRMVAWIAATGQRRPFTFNAKTYWYAYAEPGDGWVYWVSRGRATVMINRRRADRPAYTDAAAEASGALPWVHPSRRTAGPAGPEQLALRLDP